MIEPGGGISGDIDDLLPFGQGLYVGNPGTVKDTFDIVFRGAMEGRSLTDEAEIELSFSDVAWDAFSDELSSMDGAKISGKKQITLTKDTIILEDIEFDTGTYAPIYVGFHFLIDEASDEKEEWRYSVIQRKSDSLGLGAHLKFNSGSIDRSYFNLNAGNDVEINKGDSIELIPEGIGEAANYKWYAQDTIYAEEKDIWVSPDSSQFFKLGVTAEADGYKDYDVVFVKVNQFWISEVFPNPVSTNLTVKYEASQASTGSIILTNISNSVNTTISIDTKSKTIDVSGYTTGSYLISLKCDGNIVDTENLIIQ